MKYFTKTSVSHKVTKAVLKTLKKNKIRLTRDVEPSTYDWMNKIINIRRSGHPTSSLLHEFGHSIDPRMKKQKIFQKAVENPKKLSSKNLEFLEGKLEKNFNNVTDEFIANKYAIKFIKKHSKNPAKEIKKYTKDLTPGIKSYVTMDVSKALETQTKTSRNLKEQLFQDDFTPAQQLRVFYRFNPGLKKGLSKIYLKNKLRFNRDLLGRQLK